MSKLAELEASIAQMRSAIVAFSGGVDSSLVAAVAARALGDRALAVTAVSPALATGELDGARAVAKAVGITHRVIATDELSRPEYRRNDRFRCYHCKTELYDQLERVAEAEGYAVVLSGANTDDISDWRPGLAAAAEHGVRHPLVECGIDKPHVRLLARALGVPSAEKPASPCLASRLPYGTEVTPETLAKVDGAEAAVKALGFSELRVRHYGRLARVELAAGDLPRGLSDSDAVVEAVLRMGYEHVEISRRALKSGSLNAIID
jgi:uncharacterized protein